MRDKIEELKNIIYQYDVLLDYWFKGCRPADVEDVDVYITSDQLRNKAMEILAELKKEKTEGKTWFSFPTQLRVEDPDNADGYLYGIGYHDVFICGCCGGVFELEELNEDGLEIIELDWVNISDAIQ